MATSITPKSAIRKSDAIILGFAELPVITTENGTCWVMPGGEVICDPQAAKEAAAQLDALIKSNVQRSGKSLI